MLTSSKRPRATRPISATSGCAQWTNAKCSTISHSASCSYRISQRPWSISINWWILRRKSIMKILWAWFISSTRSVAVVVSKVQPESWSSHSVLSIDYAGTSHACLSPYRNRVSRARRRTRGRSLISISWRGPASLSHSSSHQIWSQTSMSRFCGLNSGQIETRLTSRSPGPSGLKTSVKMNRSGLGPKNRQTIQRSRRNQKTRLRPLSNSRTRCSSTAKACKAKATATFQRSSQICSDKTALAPSSRTCTDSIIIYGHFFYNALIE